MTEQHNIERKLDILVLVILGIAIYAAYLGWSRERLRTQIENLGATPVCFSHVHARRGLQSSPAVCLVELPSRSVCSWPQPGFHYLPVSNTSRPLIRDHAAGRLDNFNDYTT